MKNKACFLDRDGVLNVELNYLCDPEKIVLENGVIEALKILQANGFKLLVVTNQAGVARGFFECKDVEQVHARMAEIFAENGVKIDRFYYCPHHEKITGKCECRKPLPGMLLQGANEFDIDFGQSFMVGDRLTDLQAGQSAGCCDSILVLSGYGQNALKEYHGEKELHVADNLLDAVKKYIVKN